MILKKGTKLKITTIQEKDFMFLDGEFEKLSELVNGQEGVVLSHHQESEQFGERESYQVLIKCKDGLERELEIESDEFISI